jgi:Fic/DOC family
MRNMPTPQEKLAKSLQSLHELQSRGVVAIRSSDLSRTDRERLVESGWLLEVMKGWYVPSKPNEAPGDSTAWYASFWDFCAAYLAARFGTEWCLSPEQSLMLLGGNRTVPTQLIVRTPRGGNKPTPLPHGTSLFDVRNAMPKQSEIVERDHLRLFSVPAALVAVSEDFFRRHPTDARAAMSTVKDASDVLALLLEGGHSVIAARLAGAFRNGGRDRMADDILRTMQAAGYAVRQTDPFESKPQSPLPIRQESPYVNRIRLMWDAMREPVVDAFPKPPGIPEDTDQFLRAVEEIYITDAYHSLSIEGYRVNPALIGRVRSGTWNPDGNAEDRGQRDALAARGYYEAFVAVKESVGRILRGANPGAVAHDDHSEWYRRLFGPGVRAGIISATDLAGYRTGPVYIQRSMHVPPPREAVRDCMPALFDLLKGESEPAVRVVLGHFVFVYIHPYIDGNGRMGRLLMNVMLASGGYPWTVIPVDRRNDYMRALESASVKQDITPFAEFLAGLAQDRLDGHPAPEVPLTGDS